MSTFLQRKWAPPSPSLALRCSGSWGRSCTTMRSSISPTFTSSSSWERRWVHTHKLWFGIHICHGPNVSTWTFCGTDLRNSVRAAGQSELWGDQSRAFTIIETPELPLCQSFVINLKSDIFSSTSLFIIIWNEAQPLRPGFTPQTSAKVRCQ